VKEFPILFSDEMVRAILDGRKTQTRRLAAVRQSDGYRGGVPGLAGDVDSSVGWGRLVSGDRLWVREAWGLVGLGGLMSSPNLRVGGPAFASSLRYRATPDLRNLWPLRWRPSIHMPRWALRLTLEVISRRAEHLQSISERDALAEGARRPEPDGRHWNERCKVAGCIDCLGPTYRGGFARLWDGINRRTAPWASDPWVWVIDFCVLEGGRHG